MVRRAERGARWTAAAVALLVLGGFLRGAVQRPRRPGAVPSSSASDAPSVRQRQPDVWDGLSVATLAEAGTVIAAALYALGTVFVGRALLTFRLTDSDLGLDLPRLASRIFLAFSPAILIVLLAVRRDRYAALRTSMPTFTASFVAVVSVATIAVLWLRMRLLVMTGGPQQLLSLRSVYAIDAAIAVSYPVFTLGLVELVNRAVAVGRRLVLVMFAGVASVMSLVALEQANADVARFARYGYGFDVTPAPYFPGVFGFKGVDVYLDGEPIGCMLHMGTADGFYVLFDPFSQHPRVIRLPVDVTVTVSRPGGPVGPPGCLGGRPPFVGDDAAASGGVGLLRRR